MTPGGQDINVNGLTASQARDLFYIYDAVRHFHAGQAGGAVDVRDFIEYQALGLAILAGLPLESRRPFLSPALLAGAAGQGPGNILLTEPNPIQSVVVIDEIDKAPRDFPNDLLEEIESMRFRVPELGGLETPAIEAALRPAVFLTTNAERALPDTFLRRCAFLHIDSPKGEALERIVSRRLESLFRSGSRFVKDVISFVDFARADQRLKKPPSTSELLQFLQTAYALGVSPDLGLDEQAEKIDPALRLLAKTAEDLAILRSELRRRTG